MSWPEVDKDGTCLESVITILSTFVVRAMCDQNKTPRSSALGWEYQGKHQTRASRPVHDTQGKDGAQHAIQHTNACQVVAHNSASSDLMFGAPYTSQCLLWSFQGLETDSNHE